MGEEGEGEEGRVREVGRRTGDDLVMISIFPRSSCIIKFLIFVKE